MISFFQIFSTYNRLQLEITLILFWRPPLVISFCIRTVCTCILQCLQELTNSCYQIVSPEFYFLLSTYKIIAFFAECCLRYFIKRAAAKLLSVHERPINASHHKRSELRFFSKSKLMFSNKMCGFIAQLVEHRTGIAEVTGSIPLKP